VDASGTRRERVGNASSSDASGTRGKQRVRNACDSDASETCQIPTRMDATRLNLTRQERVGNKRVRNACDSDTSETRQIPTRMNATRLNLTRRERVGNKRVRNAYELDASESDASDPDAYECDASEPDASGTRGKQRVRNAWETHGKCGELGTRFRCVSDAFLTRRFRV